MEDSKLIEALRKLSSRELTRFGEFVHSPYFNKHQQINELCDYLLKLAPDFKHSFRLEKERIFAHLYPQKAYNDAFLHSLFSKLLGLLYDFLTQESWAGEARLQEIYLLRQLRKHKLAEKHIAGTIRRFPTLEAETPKEKTLAYWEDYLFHNELDLEFLSAGGRTDNPHLQLKNDALDLAFLTEKLRIACDMLSRNRVAQVSYTPTFLTELQTRLALPEQAHFLQIPVVAIYVCILQTLQNPTEVAYYQQLRQLLETHHTEFCKDQIMDMYGYALNYCIYKINQGQIGYFQDVWEIYLLLVERRYIYIRNYLPAWEYKNIITAGLRLGKFADAIAFAERYRGELEPDIRDTAYSYSIAAIHYSHQDYKKALLALQDVEFVDATYYLGARIIQLKSYYELNETEALYSLIDTFMIYLRRSKEISAYRKEANMNFVRLTRKIYQLKEELLYKKHSALTAKIQHLAQEVETLQPLANKDWLLVIIQKISAN